MTPIKVTLCSACEHCSSVEIDDKSVRIGEDQNTAILFARSSRHTNWDRVLRLRVWSRMSPKSLSLKASVTHQVASFHTECEVVQHTNRVCERTLRVAGFLLQRRSYAHQIEALAYSLGSFCCIIMLLSLV